MLALLFTLGLMLPLSTALFERNLCDLWPSRQHQEAIMRNYIKTWNGDFALLNTVFEPDVALYQDRLPNANGTAVVPISSSGDFLAFMKKAHDGWNKYEFEVTNWAADGLNVVVRWKLNAIMGPDFPPSIPTTLKEGAHVTYNGTDFLQLDPHTLRVRQVDSAQDLITLIYNLGIPVIKVH